MDSTRTYKSVKNAPRVTYNFAQLITELHGLKEILYFSACNPFIFANWVETYLSSAEKKVLQDFSNELLAHYLPGFILQEEALLVRQQEIFRKRKELMELRTELNAYIYTPAFLSNCAPAFKKEMILACQKLEDYLVKRDDYIKSSELAMTPERLNGLWQYQIEIIIKHQELKDKIDDYLAQHRHEIDKHFLDLLNAVAAKFVFVSENQREVEKHITEKRIAHEYQSAIIALMLENQVDKITRFLRKNLQLADFLHASLGLLQSIQARFHSYLEQKSDLLPRLISRDESLAMILDKEAAARQYQLKINSEIEQQRNLSQQRERAFQESLETAESLHNKKNFTDALNCYLRGAKCFQFGHMLGAGDMILKGEGCQMDALIASQFYRAAAILAPTVEQSIYAQEKLKAAYRKALTDTSTNHDFCLTEDRRYIYDVCLEIDDFEKVLKERHGTTPMSYFNAADTYLVQYKLELVYGKHKPGVVSPTLKQVCYFFEEAYNFAERLYRNSYAVYENFIHYARRNNINILEIDEADLTTKELQTIRARFKEVEASAEESLKEHEKLLDLIARKLAPIYFFIDHQDDKKLVENLCINLDIDVNVLKSGKGMRKTF